MTKRDYSQVKALWNEFRRIKFGVVGLALLGMFVVVVLIEPLIVPFPDAAARWRDMTYWIDNPRNAKPVWVNWFTSKDYAPSARIEAGALASEASGAGRMYVAEIPYKYHWVQAPSDITLRLGVTGNATYQVEFDPSGRAVRELHEDVEELGDARCAHLGCAEHGAADAAVCAEARGSGRDEQRDGVDDQPVGDPVREE